MLKAYRSSGHAEHEHMMQPFAGIPELLAELKGRGQRMAVVTSSVVSPCSARWPSGTGSPTSDPIITPDEVTHGKPHPESLEQLQALTGLAPRTSSWWATPPSTWTWAPGCWVFGGSSAVGHGFYDQEALAACGPRAYAPDMPCGTSSSAWSR